LSVDSFLEARGDDKAELARAVDVASWRNEIGMVAWFAQREPAVETEVCVLVSLQSISKDWTVKTVGKDEWAHTQYSSTPDLQPNATQPDSLTATDMGGSYSEQMLW